jgi:hypothetical protein
MNVRFYVLAMNFRLLGAATTVMLSLVAAAPASAGNRYPDTITLPNSLIAGDVGFQPEGIAITGNTAYVGSFADGTVVRADLRTGRVEPLVAADGDSALGVEIAGPLLLVAGVASGELRVYNRETGQRVALFDVTDTGLVNDITVAGNTAYFTDSLRAVLYALPIRGRTVGTPREIPLTGDYRLTPPAAGVFNANGVVALDEHTLIMAQTHERTDGSGGALFKVDVRTGHTTRIDVRGGTIQGPDGLVLRGSTLYVVQHQVQTVAELRLSPDGTSATLRRTLTNDSLDVPTTAAFGPRGALYVVSSHFFTPPSDAVRYEIVKIDS